MPLPLSNMICADKRGKRPADKMLAQRGSGSPDLFVGTCLRGRARSWLTAALRSGSYSRSLIEGDQWFCADLQIVDVIRARRFPGPPHADHDVQLAVSTNLHCIRVVLVQPLIADIVRTR